MKNLDLEKTIRAAVRSDLKERNPSDFHELYFSTLTNVTASFTWYDKYLLRQLVASEILSSFPRRVTEAYKLKLVAIWCGAGQQRQESNWEREAFNLGVKNKKF
jgi:hypothetical protein